MKVFALIDVNGCDYPDCCGGSTTSVVKVVSTQQEAEKCKKNGECDYYEEVEFINGSI